MIQKSKLGYSSRMSRRLVSAPLMICVLFPALACGSVTPPVASPSTSVQGSKAVVTIEQGKVIELEVKAGEAQHFRILLPAGQLVRLSFDQQGVDLAVAVFAPDGGRLDEFERKADAPVPEPVAFITNAAGAYQVVVRASADAGGHYSLSVEES